ncbi:branched-chain amino acid ABC transporter permease [Micromonospora echinospora]|uniref:Predicted branched-chain amino acid permease (Azaleucine resistance) n=1 Tax=Micromonospora echinospora TaxID=1877 RepID=A0A1C4YNE9_MICEC|nr:AzlC family ABC transporter permease [Micromonospora echinospora]OZV76832.1 branched-chain amino acid ABC transporter permease [Micromonospora echinospora]SCF22167.1 Predicted branched-chain amino acid permease (azaleucine resistance) [Micromonospora echinospora]
MDVAVVDQEWPKARRAVLADAAGVGVAVGALGLSFGALAVVSGFSVWQACALSLLMFSGASQFAVIGVLAAGGGALTGAATATLLGVRNALYGLNLSSLLRVRGLRRLFGAQLVIDESSAMALVRDDPRQARLAFWATGTSVFVFWNVATLVGAFGAQVLPDPEALGLDVAAPAAFLALLMPRLRNRRLWAVAIAAAATALLTVPVLPAGLPVLAAGLVAVAVALRGRRDRPDGGPTGADQPEGAGPTGTDRPETAVPSGVDRPEGAVPSSVDQPEGAGPTGTDRPDGAGTAPVPALGRDGDR